MTLQLYWPIAKIDSDERLVYGYASTEAKDSQGEIVRKEALEAALPAYMRFANIREMHRPSAVGVAKEATIDENGLWLKAKIVDDAAWQKVKEGVYKGFSIGGAVTARDSANPLVITGVELVEISLVDRPANPEAVLSVWKCDEGAALKAARARLTQKWVASDGAAFARADDAARHESQLMKAIRPAGRGEAGREDRAPGAATSRRRSRACTIMPSRSVPSAPAATRVRSSPARRCRSCWRGTRRSKSGSARRCRCSSR